MSSAPGEEQRLLDIFIDALKRKGSLNQTVMQTTIEGFARSGKTSLIKVLQGKSALEHESSTAVMEESARIELRRSTVLVEGMMWSPVADLNEEANLLIREVMSAEEERASSLPVNKHSADAEVYDIGTASFKAMPITSAQISQSTSSLRLVVTN